MSDPQIHVSARSGFAAGATRYRHSRVHYPESLSDWLRGTVGLGPAMRAIDLGAGSGKSTEVLLQSGAEVLAVEPVAAMRAELARLLPGVVALAGSAEAIPATDSSVEVVLCAQAFHWFASPAAVREAA